MNIQYQVFIYISVALCSFGECRNTSEIKNVNGQTIILHPTVEKKINPDVNVVNTQTAAEPSWDDPEFLDLIKQLNPGNNVVNNSDIDGHAVTLHLCTNDTLLLKI